MVGVDEYRLDCITRSAFADVKEIDDAYDKLCTVSILYLYTALAENFIQLIITSECPAHSESCCGAPSSSHARFPLFLQEEDKKAGGINLARYQELYAQFISNEDEKNNACYLFGPLKEVQ